MTTIIGTSAGALLPQARFAPEAARTASAPGAARAAAPATFGQDGFQRSAGVGSRLALGNPPAAGRDRGLDASITRLDAKRAEIAARIELLDRRIADGDRPATGPSLQAQRKDLVAQDQRLGRLRVGAEKLAGQAGVEPEAADRYKNLMVRAEEPQDDRSAARLEIDARDLARNAGRSYPSDKSLVAAQHQLADRLGVAQAERQALDAQLKDRSLMGDQLAKAPQKRARIEADARLAQQMIGMADRLADRRLPAPAQDVDRMKHLMNEAAQGGVQPARASQILAEAKALLR